MSAASPIVAVMGGGLGRCPHCRPDHTSPPPLTYTLPSTIRSSLALKFDCIRTPPRRWRYWETTMCEAQGKSQGRWGEFHNTLRVLLEYRHSFPINPSLGMYQEMPPSGPIVLTVSAGVMPSSWQTRQCLVILPTYDLAFLRLNIPRKAPFSTKKIFLLQFMRKKSLLIKSAASTLFVTT